MNYPLLTEQNSQQFLFMLININVVVHVLCALTNVTRYFEFKNVLVNVEMSTNVVEVLLVHLSWCIN